MSMDESYDVNYLDEDASLTGEHMSGGTAWGILTRVELDVAYSSEKALNLEILLMQVEDNSTDYEALNLENEVLSNESVQKAFEFNILSGILNSEVKELDNFTASLQMNIVDAGQRLSHSMQSEEFSTEIEEKLHDAEDSLKQTQDLVAEIRMRSAKFERNLAFGEDGTGSGVDVETESNQCSPTNSKRKQQNMQQQRHFLQMLEKSLARELDLEKKLSESRYNEEELKVKLHYAEQEIYNLEEYMEIILEKLFESEIAAELLFGASKEAKGELQTVQFALNSSQLQEREMRSKLEESMKRPSERSLTVSSSECDNSLKDLPLPQANSLKADLKEVQDSYNLGSSETLILEEKVMELEQQLRESDAQLQLTKASAKASQEQQGTSQIELSTMENVIGGLKEDVFRLESRAESAETKCTLLTKTNLELSEQLGFLENNGTEKAYFLEKKLKESDTQLEQARASVEAIEEQQSMLYTALNDMEHLIEDLKVKISKAESRAENAESKCSLLTETNLELNEEMGFLRTRIECLEASLSQADDSKIATAKDIGIRTKCIADLIMKLAMERERLQLQMHALARKKILAKKCLKTKDHGPINMNPKESDKEKEFTISKSQEDTLRESSTTDFPVEESTAAACVSETSVENNVSSEGSLGTVSNFETVRTIAATQLNSKSLVMAVLVILVSVLAVNLFRLESGN